MTAHVTENNFQGSPGAPEPAGCRPFPSGRRSLTLRLPTLLLGPSFQSLPGLLSCHLAGCPRAGLLHYLHLFPGPGAGASWFSIRNKQNRNLQLFILFSCCFVFVFKQRCSTAQEAKGLFPKESGSKGSLVLGSTYPPVPLLVATFPASALVVPSSLVSPPSFTFF